MRDKFKIQFSRFKHTGVIHIVPSVHIVIERLINSNCLTFELVFLQRTVYVSFFYYFAPKLSK